MKKLFTLLLTCCFALASWAAMPVEGMGYKLKNEGSQLYLNMKVLNSGNVTNNAEGTVVYFTPVSGEEGQFYITDNEGTWLSASIWNAIPATSANCKWKVETSGDFLVISQNATDYPGCLCAEYNGTNWKPKFYCNQQPGTANYNCYFTAEPQGEVKTYTVTYEYYYEGQYYEKQEASVNEGADYPVAKLTGFNVTTPTGKVTDDVTKRIDVTKGDFTFFKFADSFANIDTWYYFRIHSNNHWFMSTDEKGDIVGVQNSFENDPKFRWGVTGDPVNGFHLFNQATGATKGLCTDVPSVMTEKGASDKWFIKASAVDDNQFCLWEEVGDADGHYLNFRSVKQLKRWATNDAGSTIQFTAYEPEPVPGEDVTINIESPWVKEYLEKSNSKFANQAGNYGSAYFNETRAFRPDWPTTVNVQLTSAIATKATLNIYTDEAKTQLWQTAEVNLGNSGEGTFVMRNMIPGNVYYLDTPTENVKLSTSKVTVEGQLRMIATEKGFNIRDLGGWKGLGGKTVKYAQIYRGASLGGTDKDGNQSDITEDDKAEFKRIGLGAQLDLRAATNKGMYGGEGSLHSYSRGDTPLLYADFNNTMTDYGAYDNDASVVANVAWIIYELKNNRPVYFNCRQGADRTGTMAYIIEGLLGCGAYSNSAGGNQMAMDYELTGFSQANLVDNVKVGSSYRGAQEGYTNTSKLFRKLIDITGKNGVTLNTLQEKCYYYLNQAKDIKIDKADLDWFICYMLDMSEEEYAAYRPTWAAAGGSLRTVGESLANVLTYDDGKGPALKVVDDEITEEAIVITFNKDLTLLQENVKLNDEMTVTAAVDGKTLVLAFPEVLTEPGTYNFTVPEGVVGDGEEQVNSAMEFTLTIFPPAKPLGETIVNLSDVTNDKTYLLYNPTYTAKAIYAPNYSETVVWVGEMSPAESRTPASSYTEPVNPVDPNASWMLVNYNDKHYLYNMGAQQLLVVGTNNGTREATFTDNSSSVTVKQLTNGMAFFTTSGELNYLCASPQLDKPINVWDYSDSGSVWQLIENPNIEADMVAAMAVIDPSWIPTGVTSVSEKANSFKTFSLDGRLVATPNLRRGIYIRNGKKIMK